MKRRTFFKPDKARPEIKEIYNVVDRLVNSKIPAYQIGLYTTVSHQTISRIRRGEIKIENLTFGTISELYDYGRRARI
jgi:hypothetical protein